MSSQYTNGISFLVRLVYSTKAALYLSCRWESSNFEFLEWTDSNHVRHIEFVGLRSDKAPPTVVREFSQLISA
jgi:hypothetical protein